MLDFCTIVDGQNGSLVTVNRDTSSFVALADSDSISAHDNVKCLSGVDLSDYDLISCTKDGFVSAILKPMDNGLNHLM